MKAAVLYWSQTGNTEKVARTLKEGLEEAGAQVRYTRIEKGLDLDWFDYDLICVGFPSYRWAPPRPVDAYLANTFSGYHGEKRVKTGAPKLAGKRALIFCTYSGPHSGIREAIPAALYAGQFFEHLGFTVLDEWYVVGEFHGSEEKSTQGKLGDIRGRPNAADLEKVRRDTLRLVRRIRREAQ